MNTLLHLPSGLWPEILEHLLPPRSTVEQAAFLFARPNGADRFEVVGSDKLERGDFSVQARDYLELADATRARLIRRAHQLDASLVEIHSHPFPMPAAFSPSDKSGLADTVPHMWWRLKARPYFAIVVGPDDFDAAVWRDHPDSPTPLSAIVDGENQLIPNGISLARW